jgi:transposase-like protein
MDIDYFEQVGSLLFGDQWIIPMARALGVNRRTIYKWKVQAQVPDPVADKLQAIVAERRAALKPFERDLKKWQNKALSLRLMR